MQIQSNNLTYSNSSFQARIVKNADFKELKKLADIEGKTCRFEATTSRIKNFQSNLLFRIILPNASKEGSIGFINPNDTNKIGHNFYQHVHNIKEVFFKPIKQQKEDLKKFLDGFLSLESPESDISKVIFGKVVTILPDSSAEHLFDLFKYENKYQKIDIITFIKKYDIPAKQISKFLYKLTEDKESGKNLVHSLTSLSATEAEKENEYLKGLFGNENEYKKWLYDDKKGYFKAYKDYFEEEIEGKARGLIDIVKFTPNLAPWYIENLQKNKGIKVHMGEMLPDFFYEKDFTALIKELRKIKKGILTNYTPNPHGTFKEKMLCQWQALKEVLLCPFTWKFPDIRTFGPFDDGTYGLRVHHTIMGIKKINEGLSQKDIFLVKAVFCPEGAVKNYGFEPGPDSSYIIKFPRIELKGKEYESRINKENYDIRPDSTFQNALVDFYLKANNCKNAPDIVYFDHNLGCVVYRATFGENLTEAGKKVDIPNEPNAFRELFPDIKDKGVLLNDINQNNAILVDSTKPIEDAIIIDTGHSSFNHAFKPLIPGKHITIGNLCGNKSK